MPEAVQAPCVRPPLLMDFKAVIPAHYASTRLPGKVLLKVHGRPIIEYVYRNACASGAKQVLVATDDPRIVEAVQAFGAEACLTSAEHASGSDRIAEVIQRNAWPEETIIVNLQADEPMMPAENVAQVAANLGSHPRVDIATLCAGLAGEHEAGDRNIVKVVHDRENIATGFSRNVETFAKPAGQTVYRHLGIYAYRAGFLCRFTQWPRSRLEKKESLEQMRAFEHGSLIHVEMCRSAPGIGVDTQEDYEALLQVM